MHRIAVLEELAVNKGGCAISPVVVAVQPL